MLGTLPPTLFAADWIQLVIFLLFIAGSAISSLIKAAEESSKKSKQQAARQAAAQKAARKKTSVDSELEAFLKQKAGGRSEGNDRRGEAPPITAQVVRPKPKAPKPPKAPQTARTVPVETEPDIRSGGSVREHVERHLIQGGLGQRDPHLANELEQADERIESHLQHVFDHQLGSLTKSTAGRPPIAEGTDAQVWQGRGEAEAGLAAQIRAMLSSPQQASAAMVLSEILRRPEDPWR